MIRSRALALTQPGVTVAPVAAPRFIKGPAKIVSSRACIYGRRPASARVAANSRLQLLLRAPLPAGISLRLATTDRFGEAAAQRSQARDRRQWAEHVDMAG